MPFMSLAVSQVKKWINKNSKRIIEEYGLGHWTIYIKVLALPQEKTEIERGTFGETFTWYDYLEAEILLYATKMPDIAYLEATFRHELCHVVAAPADLLTSVISACRTTKERKLKETIESHVVEALATAIENAVKGHRKAK